MSSRLGEHFEFIQCLDSVAMAGAGGAGLAGDDYEAQPWLGCGRPLVEDFQRIVAELGCEVIDVFLPVRDPRFVLSEITHGTRVLDLHDHVLPNLSCGLCRGLCREAMTIKECAHRFCNECIQRWIRKGRTTCPSCPHIKLPSRRALRPNAVLDEIVKSLLLSLDPAAARALRGRADNSGDEDSARDNAGASDGSSSEEPMNDDEDDDSEDDSLHGSEDEDTDEDSEDSDMADDTEEDDSDEDAGPQRRRASNQNHPGRRNLPIGGLALGQCMMQPLDVPPPIMAKSAYGQNLDEVYADDMGYLEIFLVCLNNNLPSAVCSMARELSKRPMKLPVGATTRDAAMILAEKLVRDVLGPFDVHSIITDLSFVRDGDIWPAMSQIPLSEVCRQVTESRGPIALRYLLSDRLFSLCERIETSY